MAGLQLGGPSSSSVKNPQHFDFVSAHTIRHNVGRSRNDEFARSWYPAGAPNPGVRCKQIDGAPDP